MALSTEAYALSKSYTNMVAIGISNMYVQDTTVHFTVAATGEKASVTLPTPKDGATITTVDVDENGYLVCTLSDGATVTSENPVITSTGASELEHDITCNVSVGNAPSGTVLPQGMTFTEYAEKVHVTTLPPSVKINTPTSATHEIGEVITTLPIKATITKGTYALSKAEFYDGNTLLNTITGIPTNGVVNMDYSCNNNDTNMKIKVVATDNNGLTGNASVDIKFARGIFYGTSTTGDSCNTSALVRSLSNKELGKTSGYKFTVDIPVGTKSVIIAIPATMNLSSINFRESMNMDVLSTFTISNVDVQGANGYAAIGYKVYQYIAPTSFTQASHYDVTI